MAYRRENGLSGNHYVYVQGEISDEAMNYINTNNIRIINLGEGN